MSQFNTKGVLHSPDGVTSPVTYGVDGSGYFSVCLKMSPESFADLDRLARASGTPLDDVISKAFILYKAAADASRSGKAVGIAPTPDVLETEFIGF
jgi:hypothetical protein